MQPSQSPSPPNPTPTLVERAQALLRAPPLAGLDAEDQAVVAALAAGIAASRAKRTDDELRSPRLLGAHLGPGDPPAPRVLPFPGPREGGRAA